MIKKFHYSSRFNKNLRNLDKFERLEVIAELKSFGQDPVQSHFRVHKLRHNLRGWMSMSVSPDLRVIFRFIKPDQSEVYLYDIGTHEIYK